MQHGQLRSGQVAVHILHTQTRDGQLRRLCGILCTGYGIHRRLVDGGDSDAHGVGIRQWRARVVSRQNGQGVSTVVVQCARVFQGGQGRVDLRWGAAERQSGRVVRACADGGTACNAHVQAAVQHGQLCADHTAIHIRGADARDDDLRVFRCCLRTWHGIAWRIVGARDGDGHHLACTVRRCHRDAVGMG